jgi:hypothetical protein
VSQHEVSIIKVLALGPLGAQVNQSGRGMKQIKVDEITLELVSSIFSEAGYRNSACNDYLDILSSPFNMRVRKDQDYPVLRILGFIGLKSNIEIEDAYRLEAEIHRSYPMVQAVSCKSDDGDATLMLEYPFYYPFGLNMANFLYCFRKITDIAFLITRNHGKNPRYFVVDDQCSRLDQEADHSCDTTGQHVIH